jgi:alpha-beta hydrolase superfamily lysophospholipase
MAGLSCPVLMQWGSRDQFILRPETEKVFKSIGSAEKELVVYEGAGHESFLGVDPVRWRVELENFLEQ